MGEVTIRNKQTGKTIVIRYKDGTPPPDDKAIRTIIQGAEYNLSGKGDFQKHATAAYGEVPTRRPQPVQQPRPSAMPGIRWRDVKGSGGVAPIAPPAARGTLQMDESAMTPSRASGALGMYRGGAMGARPMTHDIAEAATEAAMFAAPGAYGGGVTGALLSRLGKTALQKGALGLVGGVGGGVAADLGARGIAARIAPDAMRKSEARASALRRDNPGAAVGMQALAPLLMGGRPTFDPTDMLVGGGAGAGVDIASQLAQGVPVRDIDPRTVAANAVLGAIPGLPRGVHRFAGDVPTVVEPRADPPWTTPRPASPDTSTVPFSDGPVIRSIAPARALPPIDLANVAKRQPPAVPPLGRIEATRTGPDMATFPDDAASVPNRTPTDLLASVDDVPEESGVGAPGIRLRHADLQEMARRMGIPEFTSESDRRSFSETVNAAIANKDAINTHIDGLLKRGEIDTSMEVRAVARMRQAEKEAALPGLSGAEYDMSLAEITQLGRLVYRAGSEAGRNLAFQRAVVPEPWSVSDVLTRADTLTNGELSAPSRRTLAGLAQDAGKARDTANVRIEARAKVVDAAVDEGRIDIGGEVRLIQETLVARMKRKLEDLITSPMWLMMSADAGGGGGGRRPMLSAERRADLLRQRDELRAKIDEAVTDLGKLDVDVSQAKGTLKSARRERGTLRGVLTRTRNRTAPITEENPKLRRQISEESKLRAIERKRSAADKRFENLAAPPKKRAVSPVLDVAVDEYAKSSRDLAAWARGVQKRLGTQLSQDFLDHIYTEAAGLYRVEQKAVDVVRAKMAVEIDKEIARTRPFYSKVIHSADAYGNFTQALNSSQDFSGLLRQGRDFLLWSAQHPVLGTQAARNMFKAARSEDGARTIEGEILARQELKYKDKDWYDKVELEITRTFEGEREEVFGKHGPADRIPGVLASDRAYAAVLNRMRADMYDTLSVGIPLDDLDSHQRLAGLVNIVTTKGMLSPKQKMALAEYSTFLWSPKMYASQFQMMVPGSRAAWGKNVNPAVRRRIVGEWGKITAARLGLLYATAYAIHASRAGKTELDPRKTSFGTARFNLPSGKTLDVDMFGPMRTEARLVAQILGGAFPDDSALTGKAKAQKAYNPLEMVTDFGQGKVRPQISTVNNLIRGKDTRGDNYGIGEFAVSHLPMGAQEAVKYMRQGLKDGGMSGPDAAAVVGALLGQTFGVGAEVRNRRREEIRDKVRGAIGGEMGRIRTKGMLPPVDNSPYGRIKKALGAD